MGKKRAGGWAGLGVLAQRLCAAPLARAALLARRAVAWVGADRRRAAWALGAPAAAAAAGLLLWGMQRSLAARPAYRVSLETLSWEPVPAWASPEALAALDRAVSDGGRETSASIFDPDLPARVGTRLAAVPWVKEVLEVRKNGPSRLAIRITWRQPRLLVPDGGPLILDGEGVFLPREGILPGVLDVPVLVGYRRARGRPDVSSDPALQAVLEMLALYEREGIPAIFPHARIRSVDVSRADGRAGRGEIVVRTRADVDIRFTTGIGPGRPSLAEQIANLRAVLERDPGLSAVREYVDVRFDRPLYR